MGQVWKQLHNVRRWATLILFLLIGLIAILYVDRSYRTQVAEENARTLKLSATAFQSRIQDTLDTRMNVVADLRAFMLAPKTLPDNELFNYYAADVRSHNPAIRALQYVDSQLNIRYIQPLKGNEAALGLGLMKTPFATKVQQAVRERRFTNSEPAIIAQGSLSVIMRAPLYREDQLLGLVQVVFDVESLLDDAEVGNDSRIGLQLRDSTGRLFLGAPTFFGEPQSLPLRSGENNWMLTVGWLEPPPQPSSQFVFLIWAMGLVLLFNLIFIANRSWTRTERLKSLIDERTSELANERDLAHSYLDIAGVMLLALDSNGRITMMNKKGIEIIGLPESTLIGMDWIDNFIPPDQRSAVSKAFTKLMEGEIHLLEHFENRIVNTTGNELTIAWTNALIHDASGAVTGILSSGEDVSERHRVRDALLESEERYRTAFVTSPNAIKILRQSDGLFLECNNSYTRLLGWTQDELVNHSSNEINTWSNLNDKVQHAQTLLRDGHIENLEVELIAKDGSVINALISSRVLTLKGEPCILSVIRDITERKQAEVELAKERDVARSYLEIAGVILMVLDNNGLITMINKRGAEIFGLPESTLIGMDIIDSFVAADEKSAAQEMFVQLIKEETVLPENYETPIVNALGQELTLAWTIALIKDETGAVTGTLASGEDVTSRKLADKERLHYQVNLQNKVKQRTADLEVARHEAEEANRAKSDFLANMSHEIRTPMNGILGMLYLALRIDMPPKLHNYLNKVQNSAKSLLVIINDILDLSKIEAGKLEIEAVEFNLDSVLEQLSDAIGVQAEKKDIEFLIHHDDELPSRLIGDPLRLGQVLLNLCGNAVKFTEQGEVELLLESLNMTETELTLQFCVRDTGIGMTPELQDRLFQKFTQSDQSTTRHFGGTGLGLVISKHLTEQMGGRIWVQESKPDQGSIMCGTVQLKIAQPVQAERGDLLEQFGPLLQNIRVLIVDDNDISREILADMLRAMHIEFSTATSGRAAIEQLERAGAQPFDVVLMDWRMPGMNGDEATRRIRTSHAIAYKPKIVMVTTYGRDEVMKLAEQARVDGFLVKPVLPSTLFDTMLTVLNRTTALRAQHAINAPDTKPDFAGARLLLVEDNSINREFAVELLHSMQIQVDQAVDGQEAVAKVQERAYDGILMDIQMPKLDGLQATRAIRKLSITPEDRFATVPIIALTAQALIGDRNKSIAAGMNDHITKPIDPELLAAALARWLKIPEQRQAAVKAAAQLQVDQGTTITATTDADLLALQNFDGAQGIYRIGGKAQAYRRQLGRFRENYSAAAEQLQALITEADLPGAEAYCHSLKGVFGSLSATALFTCITELDELLKQDVPPQAKQIESLRQLLQQAMNEIDGLTAPPDPSHSAPMEREELLSKLATLGWLLEHDLGAADELLTTIRTAYHDSETKAALSKIAAKTDRFAVDEALERIKVLCAQLHHRI